MKHGAVTSKELAEFLRERSTIEENTSKILSKVAKQATNANSANGTFAPLWAALRGAAEKLAGLHSQLAQRVGELIKDISKYSDDLHKKHKTVCALSMLVASITWNLNSFQKILLKFFSEL